MFEEMKMPELKALAKELGIENFEAMKKAELVEALENAEEKRRSAFVEDLAAKEKVHEPEKVQEKREHHAWPFEGDYAKHPKFDKFKKSHGGK